MWCLVPRTSGSQGKERHCGLECFWRGGGGGASLNRWSTKSGQLLNKPREEGRAENQEISWV